MFFVLFLSPQKQCAQKDGAEFFGATNNEDANKKIAAALLESKNTIEYFGSYLALESSLKMEQALLNGGVLRRRVDALRRQYIVKKESGRCLFDPSFVIDAVVCLLKNRYLLRGLTAFRHYLFDHIVAASGSKAKGKKSRVSRGSLGRALRLSSNGIDELTSFRVTFDLLHRELSQSTESLSNVAGRRTFRVPHAIVVEMTDSANYVRRRMKQYLRTCALSQRTFSKTLLFRASDSAFLSDGESKAESKERVEEKECEDVMYITSSTMEDNIRNQRSIVEIPVRGLHASLRQLSDGTTSVLPLKLNENNKVSLRTASSASSEEGRDLFRSSLSDFEINEDKSDDGGDDRYWEQLDSLWYTTLNLADGTNGESKEEWCGPKCKKGHVMVQSEYREGGYRSGYICDKCRGRSSSGHRSGSRERWFCKPCHADICFDCHAKTQAEEEAATKIKYTTPLLCSKGHGMVPRVLQRHSCDVCHASINGMAWRCEGSSCDYDICMQCWDAHENIRAADSTTMREASFPTRREMLYPINRAHPLLIGELVSVLSTCIKQSSTTRGGKQDNEEEEESLTSAIDETGLYQVVRRPKSLGGGAGGTGRGAQSSKRVVTLRKQYGEYGAKTKEVTMPMSTLVRVDAPFIRRVRKKFLS
jgi:hypothetical protein